MLCPVDRAAARGLADERAIAAVRQDSPPVGEGLPQEETEYQRVRGNPEEDEDQDEAVEVRSRIQGPERSQGQRDQEVEESGAEKERDRDRGCLLEHVVDTPLVAPPRGDPAGVGGTEIQTDDPFEKPAVLDIDGLVDTELLARRFELDREVRGRRSLGLNQVASRVGRDLEEDQVGHDRQDEAKEDGPEDPANDVDEHLAGGAEGDCHLHGFGPALHRDLEVGATGASHQEAAVELRVRVIARRAGPEQCDHDVAAHDGILAVVRTSR